MTVRDIAPSPDMGREGLRARLEALRDRDGWGNGRIAQELGVSKATVSQLISGKHTARSQGRHWERVEALLATVGEEAGRMPLSDHIDTPTFLRIADALRWAQRQGDIALVYGLAGSGKTWAAKRHCDAHPGVTYVCATPACNTVYALLRLLGRALDVDVRGSAARVEAAVLDALSGATPRLLILDEAHHLPQAVIDEARCVYDAACESPAPFGLALIGNDPLRSTLMSAARCAQIVSRIGRTVPLSALSGADIERFAAALGGDKNDKGFLSACREVAGKQGALRRLVKVGRDATALAASDGRDKVSASDIRTAEQVRVG